MKSIWVALIVSVVILIIAYFIFKSKMEQAQKPKSWWEDLGLGVDLGSWGFKIGWS